MKQIGETIAILTLSLLWAGCGTPKAKIDAKKKSVGTMRPPQLTPSTTNSPNASAQTTELSVVPGGSLRHRVLVGSEIKGRITAVNSVGKFVVLSFPVGVLPSIGTRLDALRGGAKIGEVQVTGPNRDTFTVANTLKGELLTGDEVREALAP